MYQNILLGSSKYQEVIRTTLETYKSNEILSDAKRSILFSKPQFATV